jgi:prephenate dehydratase
MKIISAFTSNCLVQCAVFLVNIRIKLVESGDTAKQLAELGTTTRLALLLLNCHKIIRFGNFAAGIHTVQSNKTRFVVVNPE